MPTVKSILWSLTAGRPFLYLSNLDSSNQQVLYKLDESRCFHEQTFSMWARLRMTYYVSSGTLNPYTLTHSLNPMSIILAAAMWPLSNPWGHPTTVSAYILVFFVLALVSALCLTSKLTWHDMEQKYSLWDLTTKKSSLGVISYCVRLFHIKPFLMPHVPNCCYVKGSVPYWSIPLFFIFDIRRSGAQGWAQEHPYVKN